MSHVVRGEVGCGRKTSGRFVIMRRHYSKEFRARAGMFWQWYKVELSQPSSKIVMSVQAKPLGDPRCTQPAETDGRPTGVRVMRRAMRCRPAERPGVGKGKVSPDRGAR